MPELNKLHEKYRATGLQVLGVNVDDRSSNAKSMAGRLGVRFPVLLDTEKKVSRLYDIRVMPTTVLIDRDGRVRHTHHGYKPGYEATYEKQVRELLKDGAG
jgi:peroxiredoxin